MNEYILVEFDESREVLINETPSGYKTGEVIELEPGTHTITLKDPKDFLPLQQDVNPSGTSPLQPEKVYFSKVEHT